MVKKVGTIQLRKDLTALLVEVVDNGRRFIIEKRGKPLAALVGVEALELIEQQQTTSADPQGALALAGAWGDLKERELDALLADVQAERGGDACHTEGRA